MQTPSPPKENPTPREQSPAWLQQFVDQPSLPEILLPGAWYLGLSGVSLFIPSNSEQILQLGLIIGIGVSVYFLNRKENKFGRAVLLTLGGLIVGLLVGGLISSGLLQQFPGVNITNNQLSTVLTFILLWLISSFLR